MSDPTVLDCAIYLHPIRTKLTISAIFHEDEEWDKTTYDFTKAEDLESFSNFIEVPLEKWIRGDQTQKDKILWDVSWKFNEDGDKKLLEIDFKEFGDIPKIK